MMTMSSAMPTIPQLLKRGAIIGATLTTAVLLSGCTALRFTYNQGSELAYWRANSYVDFEGAQSELARQGIGDWFRWNRATQLPDYAALLVRAQQQAAEPTTPAATCALYEEVVNRMQTAYDRAVPNIAAVALTMSPAQIRHLELKYEETNEKYADERLQRSPRERLRASVKRTVKHAETLYGSIEPAQREVIERGVAASLHDPVLTLAERKARQQEVLARLRRWVAEKPPAVRVQTELRQLAADARQSPRPAYRAHRAKVVEYDCALAAQIHNAASPAARARAVETLKGWEGDVRALAAQSAS